MFKIFSNKPIDEFAVKVNSYEPQEAYKFRNGWKVSLITEFSGEDSFITSISIFSTNKNNPRNVEYSGNNDFLT